MSLMFKTAHITFDRPGTKNISVDFRNTVRVCGASIQGYEARFRPKDRWLEALKCNVFNVVSDDTSVNFTVEFNLNDSSNNVGEGTINVLVMADVEAKLIQEEPVIKIDHHCSSK